jgi:GH25 family lysozyme M1 (1,4-beta-N-acetylmuramidase)
MIRHAAHHAAHRPMLHGGDFSAYQSKATFERGIRGSQFAAIKATEGTGYTDHTFKARWHELGQKIHQGKMSLRIAYHFLHSGNGVAQAKHFLHEVGVHGKLLKGTRLALDWEGEALKSTKSLREAASYIHKVTGTWPMVYTSASEVGRARHAVPHSPTWEAEYGAGIKGGVPFFQYSDGPGYDHDVFNGNLAALEKFAGWKS